MKKPGDEVHFNCTNDKKMAARYAPIHDMVTQLLAKIDPDGYAILLEELRAEWKPAGVEERIVELMTDASFRIHGCWYLETEILKGNMEKSIQAGGKPDEAIGRAYLIDFQGPNLLNKLGRYQARLEREFSRCLRIMQLGVKNRQLAEANRAATFGKLKLCTPVIQ